MPKISFNLEQTTVDTLDMLARDGIYKNKSKAVDGIVDAFYKSNKNKLEKHADYMGEARKKLGLKK